MTTTDFTGWQLPDAAALPPWPEWLPQHLSPSQLSMLERCPEQYRQRYVLGKKEPPSAALVWGTADGKAHQHNFAQKIKSHTDVPASEVQQMFMHCFDDEVELRGGEGEIDWRDDKPSEIKDRGAKLVKHYHEHASRLVQPTGVEEPLSLEIPGVPIPVIGYVDVDTEHYAIERKTASQKSVSIPPQYQLQTLVYAVARRKPVHLHVSTRTKLPAVFTPATEPGLELPFRPETVRRGELVLARRAQLLLALATTFGPDQVWPDGIGTMAWHTHVCEMCGFRPTCAYWRGT